MVAWRFQGFGIVPVATVAAMVWSSGSRLNLRHELENTMFIYVHACDFNGFFELLDWRKLLGNRNPVGSRPTCEGTLRAVGGQPCLIVHLGHQKVSIVIFGFLVGWVGLIPDASQHPYTRKDMRQRSVMWVDGFSMDFHLRCFGFL